MGSQSSMIITNGSRNIVCTSVVIMLITVDCPSNLLSVHWIGSQLLSTGLQFSFLVLSVIFCLLAALAARDLIPEM